MQVRLIRVGRRLNIPRWAVLIVALWLALLGILMWWQLATGISVRLCWFRYATGIACPTCGSTRALLALGRGEVLDAFRYNPLVFAVGLAGAAWLVLRVGFGRTIQVALSTVARRTVWSLLLLVFLLNWAYVIAQHLSAPGELLR